MARQQGLSEHEASKVDDNWPDSDLPGRQKAALLMTDAFLGDPAANGEGVRTELATYFSDEHVAEMALGAAMFLAMSKVLIALGLEPDEMETTVMPTPGSR